MELIALVVFLLGIGAVLVVAWRGAERARQEREQRWSRIPAVARPGLPLSGSSRSLAVANRPAARRSPAPQETPAPPAATAPSPPAVAAPRRQPSPAPRTRVAPPPIDVNAATVEQLSTLPGVGVRAAERIVAHRDRHGPFPSLDALEAVEGFDHHRVGRLARRATVNP